MFDKIIRLAIHQRWVVLITVLGMAVLGIYNYQRLPIDAVPDITNVQVQIMDEAHILAWVDRVRDHRAAT